MVQTHPIVSCISAGVTVVMLAVPFMYTNRHRIGELLTTVAEHEIQEFKQSYSPTTFLERTTEKSRNIIKNAPMDVIKKLEKVVLSAGEASVKSRVISQKVTRLKLTFHGSSM